MAVGAGFDLDGMIGASVVVDGGDIGQGVEVANVVGDGLADGGELFGGLGEEGFAAGFFGEAIEDGGVLILVLVVEDADGVDDGGD